MVACFEFRGIKSLQSYYVDEHERADVVEYRNNFIIRWKLYRTRFNLNNYNTEENFTINPINGKKSLY